MRQSLSIAVVTLVTAVAAAQPRRHDRIVAVPVPGKVTVDGDLSDWDLSGAIDVQFDAALAPRFSARLAMMYDSQALYISAHFVDDTPLRNRHDPQVEPGRGWDGDCLQVRLMSDPGAPYPLPASNSERLCHLTMWYFSDAKLPVLELSHGMDYHGSKVYTGAESGLAFRADADGQGYTLEARIPWTRLNAQANPPKAGDRIACVFQPLWSDAAGDRQVCSFNDVVNRAGFSFQDCQMWGQAVFSPTGRLAPAQRPRSVQENLTPLELKLPLPDAEAKSLSAAVFNAQGELVRTLPVAEPGRAAASGSLTVAWDGLDDDGRPLPAGAYTVKLLTHRGIGQRWVASLHNAGNPPWRTDDGRGSWGGDHGPPIAAAHDDQRVYLGWTVSEAGWSMIALQKDFTSDGKVQKLWGQHQVLEIGILVTALASDGERLFVAQDGPKWGRKKEEDLDAGVVLWDAKTGRPVNFPFGKRTLVLSRWKESIKPQDVQVYDRLSVYHPEVTRKRFFHRLRDHDFGPQELGLNLLGLAVAGDHLYGSLYLENKVVMWNWRTGQKVREVAVERPVGLAVAHDGAVLAVSARRVVRIDPATGTVTPWVTEGLQGPWGLAVDREGRVYVTDNGSAMQVKVFDRAGRPAGTIGRAGGRPWAGRYVPEGLLRPAGITVDTAGKVWVAEYDNTPRRVSVWSRDGKLLADLLGAGSYAVEGMPDLAHPRHVNVHHTLFDVDYATGRTQTLATLIRPQMDGLGFGPDGDYMGRALRFCQARDQTFLAHAGRGAVVIYRLGADLVGRPVAALGPAGSLPLHLLVKEDFPTILTDDVWRRLHDYAFWWADRNGDAVIQPEEFVLEPVKGFWGVYWGAWVDADLTIWATSRGAVWRVPVDSWLSGNVPVYPLPSRQKPLFQTLGDELSFVMPAGQDVYVLEQKGGDSYGAGTRWMAVSRYTREGKRLWAYRRTWLGFGLEAPLARPGDVVGAMKLIGSAALDHGPMLVAVNGYFGQFNLLSDQGLWVASLCKDNRYGPKADENTVWPENFSGAFFRHRDNGKVYLIAGDTDARIWEVTGLETIRTAETTFTLTPADHETATRVAAQRQASGAPVAPLRLVRAKAVTVDADLAEWDLGRGAAIDAGAGRGARVALAYDDKRLYAAFDVQDDSPMKNAGKEAALLFKTGDVCDVMVAVDPRADAKRTAPVAGDLRLSLAELEGKPVCVLFQPVVREGAKTPRTFSSPTGALVFDRVAVLTDAQVAIRRRDKGYTLEAAVPLEAIGLAPKPGLALRGDVGVIFSDAGGSRNAWRACYANKDTAITNDIPSEARLEPHKWAILNVE